MAAAAWAGRGAMSSVLYEWETFGHRYRLCTSGTRLEGWVELAPIEARWALRSRLHDPEHRRSLACALRDRYALTFATNLADHGELERELERRRLVVLDQAIAPMFFRAGPAKTPAPEIPRVRESPRVTAWIDVTVVDDSMPPRPLSGARFRLSLPDRSTLEGALDSQGHLHADDIEPGKAWLELLDLKRGLEP